MVVNIPFSEEPVFKPRKHATPNFLLNFMQLTCLPGLYDAYSSDCNFSKGMGNLNEIQRNRVVSKEEMEELYDMEEELMVHGRYYKNAVHYFIAKNFEAKIRLLIILIAFFANAIGWYMFYYSKDAHPTSEQISNCFIVMVFGYLIPYIVTRVPIFSLNVDDFVKDDHHPIPKKQVKDVITPEMLVWQQHKLASKFLKEVRPMMKTAEDLDSWRYYWVVVGSVFAYVYMLMCLQFCIIRYSTADFDGLLMFYTVFLMITTLFHFFPYE